MINQKLVFEQFQYDVVKKCNLPNEIDKKNKYIEYNTDCKLLIRIYLRNDTVSIFISSKNKKRDLMFFKSIEYEENYIDKLKKCINILSDMIMNLPVCLRCGERMIPKVVKMKTIWNCSACQAVQFKPKIKSMKDLIKD